MNAFTRWMYGREYIKLLLHWRWLVLLIAVPISFVIELIEEQGAELDLLDEVLIDGIVLPVTTWIVLTFAARKMAAQFRREADLERRHQFTQQLAVHRELHDLAHFLVRFVASVLPVQQVTLQALDPEHGRRSPVSEWKAHGVTGGEAPDVTVVLLNDQAEVGVLELVCLPGRRLSVEQYDELQAYVPDMAAALERANSDHRTAQQAYLEARAYERRRLTQELHDSLAQQLFYLHLGLDQLSEDPTLLANEGVKGRVTRMRTVAAEVYDQVRHNLSILRAWEQVNLTEAISELVRIRARDAEMRAFVDVQGEPVWMSPHMCEQVYSVVREALNNMVKHARAGQVALELRWEAERLHIRLSDDGVGFDVQRRPDEGSYGLSLMRETVDALGGTMQFQSAPGHGTSLTVEVPLEPQADSTLRTRQVAPQQAETSLVS